MTDLTDEARPAEAACPPETGIETSIEALAEHQPIPAILAAMETRLLDAFAGKLSYDAFKEKQIDRLHEELQAHRADLVAKAIRPMMLSLIRLHDTFGKVLEVLEREDPVALTPARLLGQMHGFREDVALALEHSGVSPFTCEAGPFDPRRQRAARRIETRDAAEAGQVAARLLPGFVQGETVIEKERVAVYALVTPIANEEEH